MAPLGCPLATPVAPPGVVALERRHNRLERLPLAVKRDALPVVVQPLPVPLGLAPLLAGLEDDSGAGR